MLPYILAAVGGYLIGDSLKGKQYAERGYLERGGKVYSDKEILEIVDEDEKYFGKLTPEQIKKIEDSGFDYDDEREGWVVMKNFNEAPYGDDGDSLKGKQYAEGGYMAKGGQVKVGDIITANTGVRVKVLEYDPKFGGRVRVERMDEHATGKPSQFMPLSRFKLEDGYMEGGGYVAVSEKDGYWTIISKPTTKEKAQEVVKMGGLPRGEVGKVVTITQAKSHKKLIGEEYLADGGMMSDGGYMAKGGEIYKIQRKYKYDLQPKWEDEKFHTGGHYYLSFKDAQDVKKKLQNMSSSMEYKVIKVEEKEFS